MSQYWLTSPAADAAINAAMARDHRRTWDPRRNRPSLADLEGDAKRYAGRYAESATRLLKAAAVTFVDVYDRQRHNRRVRIAVAAGESWRAAGGYAVQLLVTARLLEG